jgi:hypothetical protein
MLDGAKIEPQTGRASGMEQQQDHADAGARAGKSKESECLRTRPPFFGCSMNVGFKPLNASISEIN